MNDRPRIIDVARLAGVSTATVSRVLARPAMVSQETREVVEQAIRETGFTPNHAARNLRHQRTGGIVALVPNLANPFFSRILSGIAAVLAPAGYNLLVADTQTYGAKALLAYAEPSRADGLIVMDGSIPAAGLGRVPVVLACEWVPGLAAPRVKIENRKAAHIAINHLADLGHRRIGHVSGPAGNVLSESRLAGVREAMAERDLPLPDNHVITGDFSLASGQRAGAVWAEMPAGQRPTAVFLASDAMACGFMGEVQRRGFAVPRDVSVLGFDDIELVAHMSPPLSTIRQPREEIGRVAAHRLLGLIGKEGDPRGDTVLPVELVLRGSTGAPPG